MSRRLARNAVGFVLGVALLVLAAALATHRPSVDGVGAVPVVDRGVIPSVNPPAGTGSGWPATAPRASSSTPAAPAPIAGTRLELARLHLDATMVHVTAPGGVMQIPRDPAVLGWWSGGAAPGSQRGNVVIVGHINYAGEAGAFSVLPKARPGDSILVAGSTTVRYRVDAVHTYAKSSGLPASLFASGGAPRLELITCGGPFDGSTGNYEDNIVVFASPS